MLVNLFEIFWLALVGVFATALGVMQLIAVFVDWWRAGRARRRAQREAWIAAIAKLRWEIHRRR